MLSINHFQTVTPTRVVDDANNQRTPTAPIDVVVVVGEAQPVASERGKRFVQDGELYTRRGSDLKDGDEITVNEGRFGVVGGPQFDMVHPMTGADFGWVRYSIRKGG